MPQHLGRQRPPGRCISVSLWTGRGFERYRLIYKRGCQEHFSPYAGGADLFRDIQPLLPWKTLVWCPALGCSIAVAASSFLVATPISFETHQAVRLYGGNHGSI